MLGLLGILLPWLGEVDMATLAGTMLLIKGLVQLAILLKWGVRPGFAWRAGITIFTLIVAWGILMDPLSLHIPLEISIGGYLLATGLYVVIEGRYTFAGHKAGTMVGTGYLSIAFALTLLTGWPSVAFWTPVLALSLNLLAVGQASRIINTAIAPSD